MNLVILFRIAIRNVLKNRMRAFLTMLGIIIGVASVIVMVSIGQGAQKKIETQINSMGTNLLTIFPGSGRFGGIQQTINKLTLDDCEHIRQQCKAVDKVSPVIRSMAQAIVGTKNTNTSITGVSPEYFTIRSWNVSSGTLFTLRDIKTTAKVAVLGKSAAENLFGNQNPVGRTIRISNVPFKVIGVLEKKGAAMGPSGDQDDAIYAPSTTVLYRLVGGKSVGSIMVSAKSQDAMTDAQSQITSLLRKLHAIHETKSDDFSIMNQTEIINMAAQTTQILTLLLGAIAGVSLIVGGIGIMNIMLVSVTERTREIGIRLAIGAHESDIMVQFIVEAAVLSMIGGIVGVVIGIFLSALINSVFHLSTSISIVMVAIAFLFSGAVGIIFGFLPARKASRLNPIEALRYE
jgi:putative ABC transport system permease protein